MEFFIYDVFVDPNESSVMHGGNQLAVVELRETPADDQVLQAIATELGFSETTFIQMNTLSYSQRSARTVAAASVRIFTVERELPFAGHPTLGTAHHIKQHLESRQVGSVIRVDVRLPMDGLQIPVSFSEDGVGLMTQRQPEFLARVEAAQLHESMGLPLDVVHPDFVPQIVSTGIPFLVVPLRDKAVVSNLKQLLDIAKFSAYMQQQRETLVGVYFFAFDDGDGHLFSRMLFFENGIFQEDAATGSASGCCLAYLQHIKAGVLDVDVLQGVDMGRRSLVLLKGSEGAVRVGGSCRLVASGQWKAQYRV